MSRMILVQREFASRGEAHRWFDALQAIAWPYAWCVQDPCNRRWSVRALVERPRLHDLLASQR